MVCPFDPIDFEKRDWIPHSGWPITYRGLMPWYRRAQEICQLGPFEYEPEYWETQSRSKRLPLSPSVINTKIIQFSPPTRFGTTYCDEILLSSNVTLWTFANVTNITSNENASHLTGLEAILISSKKLSVRAKRYVLACGGLENPRILSLSNKTVPQGLGNQNDLVGGFFLEHPHIDTSRIVLPSERSAEFYKFVWPRKAEHPFIPLIGIATSAQRSQRIANYSSLVWRATDSEQSAEGDTRQLNTRLEQVPNPDSRVTLNPDKKDRLGQPHFQLKWQMTELDKRVTEGNVWASHLIVGHITWARRE